MSRFAGSRGDWRAVVRVVAFLLFVTGSGFVLHHVYQRYVLLRYIDEARLHYVHLDPGNIPLLPRTLHQQLPPALAPWFLATPREIYFYLSVDANNGTNHAECLEWLDKYPLKSRTQHCTIDSMSLDDRTIPAFRLLMRWPKIKWVSYNTTFLENFPRRNFAELDVVLTELEELGYPQLPMNPEDKLRREKLYARLATLQEPYP